jgi:amino acid permease
MTDVSSAGTELVGLAASETPNPRETMPAAVKGTFWRIVRLLHKEIPAPLSNVYSADCHLRYFPYHHRSPYRI